MMECMLITLKAYLLLQKIPLLWIICEDQPIYVHWFGLEMLRAYQSAKLQINQDKYPIKIELDSETYEIKQESLQMVKDAIKVATSLGTNPNIRPGYRGFKSCPKVRSTEVALTSLVSRALDHFIFPDQTIGACLHQAPCRKRNNPEKPDIYSATKEEYIFVSMPI